MIWLPLGNSVPIALLGHPLAGAGGPGAEPRRLIEVLAGIAGQAGAAETGPALALVGGVLGLRLSDVLGLDLVKDDVVDQLGVSGQEVGAGDHRVLGQLRVEQEAAIFIGPLPTRRARGVRRGHPQLEETFAGAQRDGLRRRRRGTAAAGRRGCRRGRRVVAIFSLRKTGRIAATGSQQQHTRKGGERRTKTHLPRVSACTRCRGHPSHERVRRSSA
jgi:hypothetical protein